MKFIRFTVSNRHPSPKFDELDEDVFVKASIEGLVQHADARVLTVDVFVSELYQLLR